MAKPKIYLRDAIYIPVRFVDESEVEEQYTRHMYEEQICRKCEYRRDRYSEVCGTCEWGGYKGVVTFFGYKNIDGDRYISLPIGDRLNIEEKTGITLGRFKVVDKRTVNEFDYKVKFTGQLRPYQEPMRDAFLSAKHGLIQAPPRTGKTVTSVAIAIALGQRTVIMADQTDFLDNFIEEIQQYTNLPQLEEKTGKKLFGFLKKDSDFENFQIGVITYQSLISDKNGQHRLKLINKNFGTLLVDEVHSANATEYSRVISRMRMKYKGGCTATPSRKDCLPSGHSVLLSTGKYVDISEVQPGDFVKSVDSDFNIVDSPVVETHKVLSDKRLVEIHHENGILTVTEDHEIWSETRNAYVKAIDLTVDDVLKLF